MQFLEKLKPLAQLLMRFALGVIFIYHGYPKLLHTRESTQAFVHMGFPMYFAYIAGILEVFGGAMLIVGLFTRLAALLLACEMGIALWKVHMIASKPMAVDNYQFPLSLAAGALVLATIGAGLISIDQAIFGGGRKAPRKTKDRD
jgi:putative oxidoreductase